MMPERQKSRANTRCCLERLRRVCQCFYHLSGQSDITCPETYSVIVAVTSIPSSHNSVMDLFVSGVNLMRPVCFPQDYPCIAVLCRSNTDPSRWCTRWQAGLVLKSGPGHRRTEPQRRPRTTGRRWWSFRSAGTARSSGHARKLQEEGDERNELSPLQVNNKMCLINVAACSTLNMKYLGSLSLCNFHEQMPRWKRN